MVIRQRSRGSAAFLACFVWAAGPRFAQSADAFTAALVAEELVARGEVWRFFRGRAEPSGGSLDWTLRGFDDSLWPAGRAGFGYADGDDTTLLSDMPGSYSTVYLRRVFQVEEVAGIDALELAIDYDDGFIAFLNGKEIARANAGPAGVYPSFDDVASESHEHGPFEVFRIAEAGEFLVPGTNVLAVVGLNASLGSGDFSLHPELRAGGPLGEGCPGDFYVSGSQVLLAGKALLATASEIRVNGDRAAFDPSTRDWSYRALLPEGNVSLMAEALDGNGAVLASLTLKAIRARALAGELAGAAHLSAAGSPYLVVGQVSVPSGSRLTIEAGCEFFIRAGTGFTIQGEVQGLGTSASPIRFTRLPCQDDWGRFSFEEASGENKFTFCEWSHSGGAPAVLTVTESSLELDGCTIRDIDGEGVHAVRSKTRIRNCLSERTREAFSLDFGDTVVEYCTVRDAAGKSDLIDANGSRETPVRIAFNHIYGTTDDGIDADGSSMIIEGNIIHDCGDQAMSLVGAGESRVFRNLCYRNGNGLSVKDSHVSFADFNTFVLNTITGVRAIEKTSGRGGGVITLRSSIVWGNTVQLLTESTGSIDAAYNDVEGPLVPGPGNLNLDPLFADPAAFDFRLRPGSPCIGAAATGEDLGAFPFELVLFPPSELEASHSSYGVVTLSWRDNSSIEQGFQVERDPGGGFEPLTALPANTHSYTDLDLAAGRTYHYRVRAFNDSGASAYSGIASVTIGPPPQPEVLGVEPVEGPSSGGTVLIIRGSHFHGEVTARLGGSLLAQVELWSAEEVRGVAPAGARGSVDLQVEAIGGGAVLRGAFTYFDARQHGDANADGNRDLSDALAILAFLYQNGQLESCPAAADVQGDGAVDIGDAIFLLWFLYGGGAAPTAGEARCY